MSEQDQTELDDVKPLDGAEPVEIKQDKPAPDTSDKTGLRDTLKTSIAKVNADREAAGKPIAENLRGVRGPDGKFLPKDTKAAPDGQQPQETKKPLEGDKTDAVPKKDAAPGTWKPEARAKWDTLDPAIKAEVQRRESESSREVAKFQQQIQQINQAYTPIEQVIAPKRALWRAQFGSEGEALKTLVNISDLASQNPSDFLNYYLSQPGIAAQVDVQKIFGPQAGAGVHPQAQPDHALLQKINGLEQQVSGFLNQQQTQQLNTVQQQIENFVKETDESGAPKRPHFDAVREKVFSLIPSLKAESPNASVAEIFQDAYDIAVRKDATLAPEIQRQDEERIRANLEKQDRARRAQLANKSIPPGAPPANATAISSDPNDLRATLKRNFKKFANGEDLRI